MKNFAALLCVLGMMFLFTFGGIVSKSERANQTKDHPEYIQDDIKNLTNSDQQTKKVWILFKDKGFKDQISHKHSLKAMAVKLTPRCLERRKKVMKGDNLFTFEDVPVFEDYIEQVKQIGVKIRTRSRWLNAISIEANTEQIEKIKDFPFVKEFKNVAAFKRIEPLKIQEMQSLPYLSRSVNSYNFDYGSSLAQLEHIRVPEVHQKGLSGKGVLICIMDAGFRKDHEVFQHANIVAERDFIFNDNDTQTDPSNMFDSSDRHGTVTWSNLGGFKEGKLIGPAYGADFLLAKTEDTRSETPVEEDYWVAAAEWADSLGAQIFSVSLAYFDWYTYQDLDGNTATITKAADRAVKLGIVVITAAGNYRETDWGHISPPADGDSVIAIGAFDIYKDALAFFSSPGPTFDGRIKPEVVASGYGNYCASNSSVNAYDIASGTSVSCPLVAGVAALILEQHPTWSPIDVRNALMYTASQYDHPDNDMGWGIVDAYKAIFDTAVTITVQNISYNDFNGNNNNLPEPGESIFMRGTLSCKGRIEQNKYFMFLRIKDPYISLMDSVETVDGLVSYGKIDLSNAFSFRIDSNAPENHLVNFDFLIKDEIGNTWQQNSLLKIVIQRNISGVVNDAPTGAAIPNAIVTWTHLDADSNKIVNIDTVLTDGNGRYNLPVVGGNYAVQVSANGYSTENARMISIPASSSQLDFNLHIADFQLYPYSFRFDIIPGNEFVATLEISNTGTVPIFYNIQENNPLSIGYKKFLSKPEMLLRPDPIDNIPYDLEGIFCEQDSQRLALKITTYQEIASKDHWNLSVYLDTDVNQKTGYQIGNIGADYQLSYVESGAKLSKYIGGAWENTNFSCNTSLGKKLLHFSFSSSFIGDPEKLHLVVVLYDGDMGDSRIIRDIIPDDGGLSNVTFSRYKSNWLTIEQPYNVIPNGASDKVKLFISVPDPVEDLYGTELILSTNSPKYGEIVIPIYFGDIHTDLVNNNKVPIRFDLEQNFPNPFNSQTKIRFSLPTPSKVNLIVINSLGQKVKTLCSSDLGSGFHTLYWDGKNSESDDVSSGIYFISLEAGDWSKTIKALLLR
jgi:serine protease AprX